MKTIHIYIYISYPEFIKKNNPINGSYLACKKGNSAVNMVLETLIFLKKKIKNKKQNYLSEDDS
jgi:hypothetical protein